MKFRLLLLIAILLAPFAPMARAASLLDAPLSYSATRSVTVDGKLYTGPMFHEPGRERHEQVMLGMQEVFILDQSQGAGSLILPALKTMVAFPFPPLLSTLLDSSIAKSAQGEETIGGISATKYRVDQTAPDGTHGDGFLWISRRGVLVKLAGTVTAPGGHRTVIDMVLSGLQEGPQKSDLFVAPAGLAKLPAEALAPLLGFKLQ